MVEASAIKPGGGPIRAPSGGITTERNQIQNITKPDHTGMIRLWQYDVPLSIDT